MSCDFQVNDHTVLVASIRHARSLAKALGLDDDSHQIIETRHGDVYLETKKGHEFLEPFDVKHLIYNGNKS